MSTAISGHGNDGMPSAASGTSMRMAPHHKMSHLYHQIDTKGAGSITQSQFKQAFDKLNPPAVFKNEGSTAVWNALDPNGAGQVSQQDFVNGMKNLMVQLRQGSHISGPAQTLATTTHALNVLG